MARPTNVFDTYDGVNPIREDLADIIYDISPTETPFMSNIRRGSASNTYHEWQSDKLKDANVGNAHLEGDDTDAEQRDDTTRLGNYSQISKKLVTVSGTQEAVNKAGMRSQMAYQMSKASKELKRDMESILLNRQPREAGSGAVARTLAGFPNWLTSNTDIANDGGNVVYTTGPDADRTDGTQRAFTEDMLKDVQAQAWQNGGEPTMLMVGPYNKGVVSGFAGLANQRFNTPTTGAATLIGTVDVYIGDFGTLNIVPNRFQRERDVFFVDPEYAQVSYLRNFKTETLGKTGDNIKKHIVVEYTLRVNNEAAHGLAADIHETAP